MKKSSWLIPSICLMTLATATAMAGDTKTGEHREVPPQSVSDIKDKKVTDPYASQRVETPPKSGCDDGDAGSWCRAWTEDRK